MFNRITHKQRKKTTPSIGMFNTRNSTSNNNNYSDYPNTAKGNENYQSVTQKTHTTLINSVMPV